VRSDHELLHRVCDTLDGYLALGNEVTEDADVRFVRNPTATQIWDANHGSRVRARSTGEIERVLARAEETFGHLKHRRWMCDPLTPPEFEARLVLEDYRVDADLQLLLEGDLRADPPEIDVRAVETDADWESVARLTRLDHEEEAVKFSRPVYQERVTRQMVGTKRAKCPPLRFFVARVDGVDCAFFSSWPGENGVGKVEDLFTHPDFRGRGIATALIVRCVLDARERGAGPVLIAALPSDTPKLLYERIGFRPLCITRGYLKTGSGPGRP
jgi:GNAT superfamily N-acetyltransferase